MIEIYLIRHGQASFGQPAYDHLSTVGERQAELLGRHFLKKGIHFYAVYSGALRRHVQTATIAMSQMNGGRSPKITIDSDLFYADANEDLDRLALYDPLDDDSIEHFRRRFLGAR